MGQDSKIQWTTHTFNPWRGCTKVSDGCKFCYADTLSKRNPKVLGIWGPSGTRVVASEASWREPLKWDKAAAAAGERHRVFCASLADVFEGPETMPANQWETVEWARRRLFKLICITPNLDWLLLTKRPENALGAMVRAGLYAVANPSLPHPQPNIWIGTSVENQEAADVRVERLLKVPAVIRFLSCEPLLSDLNLSRWVPIAERVHGRSVVGLGLHWVIIGGESGGQARPCNLPWVRNIVQQCKAAGVAPFVKQLGAKPIDCTTPNGRVDGHLKFAKPKDKGGLQCAFCQPVKLKDSKGGDIAEFPDDLQVRELPSPVERIPASVPA